MRGRNNLMPLIFSSFAALLVFYLLVGAWIFAQQYPGGLKSLPVRHVARKKGFALLFALCALLCGLLLIMFAVLYTAFAVHHHYFKLAVLMMIPLIFTWICIDLVLRGSKDTVSK